MTEKVMYAAIITMLIILAMELGKMAERITRIQDATLSTEAMVTSMFSQGRVGQEVK